LRFRPYSGILVPAVTAEQMREADRIAVVDFGLGVLQMMESVGRKLAENAVDMLGEPMGAVAVLAGPGGNGGGGLCCARHLHNRGLQVSVILDREPEMLGPAASNQLHILQMAGVPLVSEVSQDRSVIQRSALVVDALLGYGLLGSPRGRTLELIDLCNEHTARILSLDVPSGLNASTGEAPGSVVHPDRTLTLALPKTGLKRVPEDLYLADIGIPPEVPGVLGLRVPIVSVDRCWIPLQNG
jgi:NAD(P)H-hydrate epimerase